MKSPLSQGCLSRMMLGVGVFLFFAPASWAQSTTDSSTRKPITTEQSPSSSGPLRFKPQDPKNIYTSRPLFAVGRLKTIDSATSTVVISIDRKLSSAPHILLYNAKRAGVEQELMDREFPPERAFLITRRTFLLDAKPDPRKPQTRASTGKIREDKQFLPFSAFKPGDFVGVMFSMSSTGKGTHALNLCRLDPNQKDFGIDYAPMRKGTFGRKARFSHQAKTTSTLSQDTVTTHGPSNDGRIIPE